MAADTKYFISYMPPFLKEGEVRLNKRIKFPDKQKMVLNIPNYIMLAPAIIYIVVFGFYPVISGVKMSFYDIKLVGGGTFIGLGNFKKLIQDPAFWSALKNTFIFAFWNCLLGVVLSLAVAILLNEIRKIIVRRLVQTVIYLPNLLSWVVVGSSFMFLLSPTVGPVNQILQKFGQEAIYFFGETSIARALIIFINQWKITGYGVVIYMAALVGISTDQYECATLDGANRFQQIWYITIPNLQGTIMTMLMLNVMGMFQLFDPIYVMSNRITQSQTDVLMTYIYRTSLGKAKLGPGAAASTILMLIALAFTLVTKKITNYGVDD